VIANFGSIKHRLVYSMIGEGISIAKTLQHQAGANGCLLSGDTYALVEESLGELPRFAVSYKAASITAYKL
jgi:class 3 adenylate cyclase